MADASSTPPAKWGDLGVRAISALVLVPLVLAGVWAGGIWFEEFVALLAVLMAYEWCKLTHRQGSTQFAIHAAAALAGALIPIHSGPGGALIVIAVLWLASAIETRRQGSVATAWPYLGVPYVGLPAMALVLLRSDPVNGLSAIVWVMVTVWSADTLAYFAGRIIGGPRLAPVISPKKTWAGLGGAVAGSTLVSSIFAYTFQLNGISALAVLAASLALVEQVGDLFESALKRFHGVKDSGTLIPGHGGVIDRVDGLIAVAVFAAVFGLFRDNGISAARGLLQW